MTDMMDRPVSTTKPAVAKGFFDLPLEVRNLIYKNLLPRREVRPQVQIKTFTEGRASAGIKHFKFPTKSLTVSKAYEAEASTSFA